MTKKSDISDNERQTFRQAMLQIQPIHLKDKLDDTKIIQNTGVVAKQQKWVIDNHGYFFSCGIQKRVLRQLKSRGLAVDAKLDLHGYRLSQAETKMVQFLSLANEKKWRLALIIHGKGERSNNPMGKIKEWLFKWLPDQPGVLAWQPAVAKDGGNGAGYLLLQSFSNEI